MANPAYMTLYDEQDKMMAGNVTISGREHCVEILAFQHGVYIPTDRDTGTLTSTRKHEALTITKAFCQLSPELVKACCDGKTLKKLIIDWYRIDHTGKEQKYFTHRCENVKVVSVRPQMLHIKNVNYDHYTHEEEIAFRYEAIYWTYHDGNRQASDTWNVKC